MRSITLTCILAGLFTLACAEPPGASTNGTALALAAGTPSMDEIVDCSRALELAQISVPDGYVLSTELELVDDDGGNEPPAWEVELFIPADGSVIVVEIHAETEEILYVGPEVEDDDD